MLCHAWHMGTVAPAPARARADGRALATPGMTAAAPAALEEEAVEHDVTEERAHQVRTRFELAVGRMMDAWLTAHRRLARDYERDPAISEAMIRWASINTMTRRLGVR